MHSLLYLGECPAWLKLIKNKSYLNPALHFIWIPGTMIIRTHYTCTWSMDTRSPWGIKRFTRPHLESFLLPMSCMYVSTTNKVSSILCPWREAHGYSTPQFRSHAVHDWMVTEWQLHACINHYQGYIKGWLNKALKTFLLTLYVTQNCMRHNDGIAQTGRTTNSQKTPYTFPLRGSYIHYG